MRGSEFVRRLGAFMRIVSACRNPATVLLVLAGLGFAPFAAASAGEIADRASEAERLLGNGDGAAALAAFDKAASAFWIASPLQFRVITFADSVKGIGDYQPRAEATFRPGDTVTIYLEPFGFGFAPNGEGFRSGLSAGIEIRTPGGIILAKADDVGQLDWKGRTRLHEVHASIALPLPAIIKPGDYELTLTVRDRLAPKSATAVLPFSVAE
jgi:hypothetical protein